MSRLNNGLAFISCGSSIYVWICFENSVQKKLRFVLIPFLQRAVIYNLTSVAIRLLIVCYQAVYVTKVFLTRNIVMCFILKPIFLLFVTPVLCIDRKFDHDRSSPLYTYVTIAMLPYYQYLFIEMFCCYLYWKYIFKW